MTDELGDAIGVGFSDAPGAGAIEGVGFVTGLGFGLGSEGEAGTSVGVGVGTGFVRCADAADVITVQVTIAKITRLTRSIFIFTFTLYPLPFALSPFIDRSPTAESNQLSAELKQSHTLAQLHISIHSPVGLIALPVLLSHRRVL